MYLGMGDSHRHFFFPTTSNKECMALTCLAYLQLLLNVMNAFLSILGQLPVTILLADVEAAVVHDLKNDQILIFFSYHPVDWGCQLLHISTVDCPTL
jgi:hypothetical protein